MAKELTDRIKNEIVETQIEFLKTNYPDEGIDYNKLKVQLNEGLQAYSSKNREINELVDFKLLRKLQDGNSKLTSRLFGAAMQLNHISHAEDLKDKHLLALYEQDRGARNYVRNYGEKTSQLLVKYLTKKGFIGEENDTR